MRIRKPAVAGSFYPKDGKTLEKLVDSLLGDSVKKTPLGVISPHAGYVYSGKVAGKVYGLFRGLKDVKFLLLGPSHFVDFEGISFGDYECFETPLGLVSVDRPKIEDFLGEFNSPAILDNRPHLMEHSIEVQLPFLQRVVERFSIIPVVYGRVQHETLVKVVKFFCKDGAYLIVSSDLSHYYPEEVARRADTYCHEGILKAKVESLEKCEACGKMAILASLIWSKSKNLRPELVAYSTSAEASGRRDRVVGYGGYAFF